VISRRYERASIVLTTNRGDADGQILEDTTVAVAILDRWTSPGFVASGCCRR
jgi:hypothetical protein